MYIRREIEPTIDRLLKQGKVVLVTGARQVGKTTALKERLGDSFDYISMENPRDNLLAKQDASLFFESRDLPLIIDEVQRVPELFSPIKWVVDQSDKKGRIVLSGSQTYHLMKGVSESLAGRIRIVELPSLSLRELTGRAGRPHPYIPAAIKECEKPLGLDIWASIHRGSMPELQDESIDWDSFYSDYVSAYLERDVRDLISVKDEAKFYSFMVACAARSGQLSLSVCCSPSGPISARASPRHPSSTSWTQASCATSPAGRPPSSCATGRWRATCSRPSSSPKS